MTGQRIIRPDTAFSISPVKGQKRPREKNEAHLQFIAAHDDASRI